MCKRLFIIYVVVSLLAVPIMGQLTCNIVYADSVSVNDYYVPLSNDEEMYQAFLAYCKSRKVFIDGSILSAVSVVTSDLYQSAVKTLGLDMNALQASLYKYVENNQTVKWGLGYLGVNAFNSILGQILQNYNLSVGDEDVDVTVKSGKWWQDADGVGCWCFVPSSGTTLGSNTTFTPSSYGSSYYYGYEAVANVCLNDVNLSSVRHLTNSQTVTLYLNADNRYISNGYRACKFSNSANGLFRQIGRYQNGYAVQNGYVCICYSPTDSKYWVGAYRSDLDNCQCHILINDATGTDTTVNITSPKVEPPLDPPSGDDLTVIEPDGTIPEPDPDPDPPGGTVPDWTLPDTQITPIDPENPSGGSNLDWNFQLPDLNIDWNINLGNKFPFCIPGDIYDVTTTLSTEPVAPQFSGTIDLLVYQWEFDIDLSMFDSIAVICRNAFFILFVVGLIALSRAIIMKG